MKKVKLEEINPYVRFAKLQYQHIGIKSDTSPLAIAPDWRLFVIENGRVILSVDDEKFSAGKNTVIIIPPKTKYCFFKQTHDNESEFLLYVINFDLFLNEENKAIPALSPTMKETKQIERYENVTLGEFSPVFVGTLEGKAREYLDDLRVKKSLEKSDLDISVCSCLLKLALIEIIKNASNTQINEDIISTITTYVASNIGKNFTIKEMADDLFFHPFYISKVFKSAMHVSLHDYIMSERLQHAKLLLNKTDYSIEKISTLSGFVNTSHFCKLFFKHFSITPAKFRKENN